MNWDLTHSPTAGEGHRPSPAMVCRTKRERCKWQRSQMLSLIFEFEVVNIHSVAVFDAHFFQTGKQTAFTQLHIEVVAGFVVIKIDVLNHALQPAAGDEPGAAIVLDFESRGICRPNSLAWVISGLSSLIAPEKTTTSIF